MDENSKGRMKIDTKFKKGVPPWNKGIKGVMKPNSGSFKKGMIPSHKKNPWIKVCPQCFSVFEVRHSLKRTIACSRSCSSKLKVKRGNQHHNWISDRSKLKIGRTHAYDSRYREWMRQVKNRDGWKCKISNGDCSGRVEAHHILSWHEHAKLRYELNNGITLCHFHHPRRREDEKRLAAEFQQLVSVSKV